MTLFSSCSVKREAEYAAREKERAERALSGSNLANPELNYEEVMDALESCHTAGCMDEDVVRETVRS